jgi:hypothetical protein
MHLPLQATSKGVYFLFLPTGFANQNSRLQLKTIGDLTADVSTEGTNQKITVLGIF